MFETSEFAMTIADELNCFHQILIALPLPASLVDYWLFQARDRICVKMQIRRREKIEMSTVFVCSRIENQFEVRKQQLQHLLLNVIDVLMQAIINYDKLHARRSRLAELIGFDLLIAAK
jgi:hypothetical protein